MEQSDGIMALKRCNRTDNRWNNETPSHSSLQGEPKKCPNTKVLYLRNAWIFLYRILPVCLQDNCANMCSIYLAYAKLTETQTSGTNFANCTEGWRYKSKLNRALSTTFVTTSMWRHYFL